MNVSNAVPDFAVTNEEIKRFDRLDEDQQEIVRAALKRTRITIDAYLSGEETNFGILFRQMRELSQKVLETNGLVLCVRHLDRHHRQLFGELAAGSLSADEIKDRFAEIKADLGAMLTAFRKRNGGDDPLGDTVSFAHIGASAKARWAEPEGGEPSVQDLYQETYGRPHATPRPHIWSDRTPSQKLPEHITRGYFDGIRRYLDELEPEQRETLHSYCHGFTKFKDLGLVDQVSFGLNVLLDPDFKTAVKSTLLRTPEKGLEIEHNFLSFSESFLRNASAEKAKEADRGGPSMGGR